MSGGWRQELAAVREARDAEIVALRRAGLTYDRIGARFGISGVMVLKILRKYDEAPPPKAERNAAGCARLAARIAEVHSKRSAS